jgi:hypothetical protein
MERRIKKMSNDYKNYSRKDRREIKRLEAMIKLPPNPKNTLCPCCNKGKLWIVQKWHDSGSNHPIDTVRRACFVCFVCNIRMMGIYPHIQLDEYEKRKEELI